MLKDVSVRVLRTLGMVALSTTLGATACDAPAESEATSIVHRDANDAQIAQALAQDADFLTLIDGSVELAGELYAAQRTMPDETVEAIAVTINHPSFAETTDPPTLVADLGGNPALLASVRSLSTQLLIRYNLNDAAPERVQAVFTAALQQDDARSHLDGAIENELHDVEGDVDTSVDECEALCITEYSVLATIAVTAYIAQLVAAVAAGPVGPVIAVIAIADFNFAMATAQGQLNVCMDECNGIFSNECGWDPDCGVDEYCWRGPLGFGKNECRPIKDEGKVCSRDSQCESDCCKYHFWSNPVSQVCRPSDRCN